MFAVLRQILATEGPLALYKGIIPMYVTIGPQTVIIFVILEQIRRLYREFAYPDYVAVSAKQVSGKNTYGKRTS